ncbi:hypothetical protein G5I_04918 [Acromyrmex echinatior]|uniref:Uncharacterized protein n=1 Tax=Acromyrmex echinatior TaxID=103372 RepID=F4WGW7_ACREC|nr:hypothetical protein G5I_04918 [Acromyrmex echinatior]
MQEEQKNTPKLGTIRKIRNAASTPDVARNLSDTTLSALHNISRTTSRNRVTLMPSDIAQLQKVPRKKIVVDKQPIMPSQIILDAQKKTDSEELELGLLYDEYLQTMMMDLIMKKKILEKKRLMIMQMAAMAQEIDQDTQKLIKIKTRERDIINLSLAQKEADVQLIAMTKYTVNTANLIGSKGEMYCAVNAGLKNFTETCDEIKNLQKKLEEALCNLQVLMLKNASLSLACDDSG